MIPLLISLSILLSLMLGAYLQRRATEWIVDQLRTDLSQARQSASLVKVTTDLTETLNAQAMQLEKLDGQVLRLVGSNMLSAIKVRDLQTGEAFSPQEEATGRRERVPIPGANDPLPPEGFAIDGKPVPTRKSPETAVVFAART